MDSTHLGIFGASGSGKTTLVKQMLKGRDRVICLDVKNEINKEKGWEAHFWNGSQNFGRFLRARADRKFKIAIAMPLGGAVPWAEIANEVAYWVMLMQEDVNEGRSERRVTLYFDEASKSLPVNIEPRKLPYVADLPERGRSYGVELVIVSQRPTGVNKDVRGNLARLVSFRLVEHDDQREMEKKLGPDGKGLIAGLKNFEFIECDMTTEKKRKGKVLKTKPPTYTVA